MEHVRIFNYLNVSNEVSIWADSGFHVQRNVINEILKKRNDYHFYVTLPKSQIGNVPFNTPLVTLLPYDYTGGAGNKYHFDTKQLWKLMDMRKKDWDFLISNEVLLGNHFLNLFCYRSHFDIPIVNYIHWVNPNQYQKMDMWSCIYNCSKTYCNSEYGKELALNGIDDIFKEDVSERIRNNLRVLHVGFNDKELLEQKTTDKFDVPTLVFNHRISQYTGYEKLIKMCQKLYKENVKFKLVFTNPATPMARGSLRKYPFIEVKEKPMDYQDYIKLLWKSDICFGLHTGENQWSIAFLEALFCNNIPITTNDIFFKEMLGEQTFELDDLRYVIENIDDLPSPKYPISRFYWRNLVNDYIEMYESVSEEHDGKMEKLLNVEKSKVFKDLETIIKERGVITKHNLGIVRSRRVGSGVGCQTPFSKYRKALLEVADDMIEKEESMYKIKDPRYLKNSLEGWL